VVEPTEDLGSFYVESSHTASDPVERVDQAEGLESVETEFAAEAGAVDDTESPAQTEEHVDHVVQTDSFEESDEAVAGEPIRSTPVASYAAPIATPTPARQATPVRTTPVATTGMAADATDFATPPDSESDAFATETMAKLYLSQGHLESALGIYRTLSARQPDDESLRRQIEEIEDRVLRRRREPTPSTPIDASPTDAVEEFAQSAPRAGVPTIRDFLLGIIRRGAPAATSGGPKGGTIDALFDAGDALDDDLVAADTLAQAFAPPEPERDSLVGRPAREASTELSLDRVFRQATPAHAGEASAGGFSFDQFFAGERTEDSEAGAPGKPGDDDDIEQFNAWLNGLKKS